MDANDVYAVHDRHMDRQVQAHGEEFAPRFIAAAMADEGRATEFFVDDSDPQNGLYWACSELEAQSLDPTLTWDELEELVDDLHSALRDVERDR